MLNRTWDARHVALEAVHQDTNREEQAEHEVGQAVDDEVGHEPTLDHFDPGKCGLDVQHGHFAVTLPVNFMAEHDGPRLRILGGPAVKVAAVALVNN